MKKTKKLLACLIAAATMFTMGSTAFAEETETPTTYTDQSKVTIKKQYNLEGQGSSPAEDFTFEVDKTSVSDSAITDPNEMPDISVNSIHFDEKSATSSASTEITLPDYSSVGVYTYTITEVSGKTAGVIYDTTPVVLKVTVVDENGVLKRIVSLKKDNKKLDKNNNAFTNTYRAGTLDISKNVNGNLGDKSKYFAFDVTNTGRFVVVLPDKYVQGLEVSENHLIIDTKEETDAELENKIKEDMQHQLVKVDKNGEINDESYRVNVRGAEIEQQKAMVAIVASLFMYIAFILISAVGTILAVQSLSDSTKYKYRYLTLRRLGINDKSLFKTIRKQLLILFCVPAISAILCSFVMMSSLNNVYQQILGDKHLYLIYFGLNLIIFFLIYSIYWIATYIGFKRNINEES